MHPLYFGSVAQPLFGVYHAAHGRSARDTGVVLCQPLGHEYIRTHRVLRNLAVQLSREGFHTFRFDYFGEGDSAGESDQLGIEQCLRDVETAIEELKDTVGVRTVSLVGLRLGATFAGIVAARRPDVSKLVLWDPVYAGGRYLQEILSVQEAWLAEEAWLKTSLWAARRAGDEPGLIGLPLTEQMKGEFERLNLELRDCRAREVFLRFSDERFDAAYWRRHVATLQVPSSVKVVPSPGDWDKPESVRIALLAHQMVKEIVQLLM